MALFVLTLVGEVELQQTLANLEVKDGLGSATNGGQSALFRLTQQRKSVVTEHKAPKDVKAEEPQVAIESSEIKPEQRPSKPRLNRNVAKQGQSSQLRTKKKKFEGRPVSHQDLLFNIEDGSALEENSELVSISRALKRGAYFDWVDSICRNRTVGERFRNELILSEAQCGEMNYCERRPRNIGFGGEFSMKKLRCASAKEFFDVAKQQCLHREEVKNCFTVYKVRKQHLLFSFQQEEKILNEPAAIYWFNEILLVILSGL